MKSPDEIKKGLECCNGDSIACKFCPYNNYLGYGCTKLRNNDALAYIQQLEAERDAPEDNKFQYETGFVKGFEAAHSKWISCPNCRRNVNKCL